MHFLSSRKGLTLVEVLGALTLLLPTLLVALYVLTAAQGMSEESRERLLALNAARSTLEIVKDTPLVNVPNINTVPLVPTGLRNGAIAVTTNPANLGAQTLATVTVTVNWLGAKNRPRSLQVTTMRSRY